MLKKCQINRHKCQEGRMTDARILEEDLFNAIEKKNSMLERMIWCRKVNASWFVWSTTETKNSNKNSKPDVQFKTSTEGWYHAKYEWFVVFTKCVVMFCKVALFWLFVGIVLTFH